MEIFYAAAVVIASVVGGVWFGALLIEFFSVALVVSVVIVGVAAVVAGAMTVVACVLSGKLVRVDAYGILARIKGYTSVYEVNDEYYASILALVTTICWGAALFVLAFWGWHFGSSVWLTTSHNAYLHASYTGVLVAALGFAVAPGVVAIVMFYCNRLFSTAVAVQLATIEAIRDCDNPEAVQKVHEAWGDAERVEKTHHHHRRHHRHAAQ